MIDSVRKIVGQITQKRTHQQQVNEIINQIDPGKFKCMLCNGWFDISDLWPNSNNVCISCGRKLQKKAKECEKYNYKETLNNIFKNFKYSYKQKNEIEKVKSFEYNVNNYLEKLEEKLDQYYK